MPTLREILHEIVDHLDLSPVHREELKGKIEEHTAPEPEPEPLADDTAADGKQASTTGKSAPSATFSPAKTDGA